MAVNKYTGKPNPVPVSNLSEFQKRMAGADDLLLVSVDGMKKPLSEVAEVKPENKYLKDSDK
jgi:hypothetical protein